MPIKINIIIKTKYENIRISFPITGLWILLFSLPLFISFKDSNSNNLVGKINIKKSFNQILITFKDLQKYKNIIWFLIARLFYMDGINAIFAVAAILTPPDPVTQIGLAIPLLLLYEVSIWSVKIIEKKIKEKEHA